MIAVNVKRQQQQRECDVLGWAVLDGTIIVRCGTANGRQCPPHQNHARLQTRDGRRAVWRTVVVLLGNAITDDARLYASPTNGNDQTGWRGRSSCVPAAGAARPPAAASGGSGWRSPSNAGVGGEGRAPLCHDRRRKCGHSDHRAADNVQLEAGLLGAHGIAGKCGASASTEILRAALSSDGGRS